MNGLPGTMTTPIVAMLCTRGMEAFLSNALSGMLRAGIAPGQVLVACPPNAEDGVRRAVSEHSLDIAVLPDASLPATADDQYAGFGSAEFSDISWAKIALIRRLVDAHEHIVYADLDIGWLRNPLPYLAEVARQYPIAFQTEGLPRFPPAICCGLISLRRSDRTIELLDTLLVQSRQSDHGKRIDDQAACQQLIARDATWLKDIYFLPEALFVNGLGYPLLQHAVAPVAMEHELQPYLFHANWTVGLESKRKLLAAVHCWFVDDGATSDMATPAPAAGAPIVAVLYPVFDVRGDVADHVRAWIDRQVQIAPKHFQIIVAASTETAIDEAALRRVLRPWDLLVRVPNARQDTELWNAAASAATAPWLLFVEAHGRPESDALAALTAWIAANPDKRACNFQIRNPDDYRVARLMKRWFAQIQQGWVQPTTWRRLHRTAYALRRDVFDRVGPLDRFGQFGPPLLSARLHQRNIAIATLPNSGLLHEDSPDITVHIDDTADYVRGELAARTAASDAEFFETYFGPSPFHGTNPIVPAGAALRLARGLLAAAWRQPGAAASLLRQALRLLPSLVPLRVRQAWLTAMIRLDAFLLMRLPLSGALTWTLFRDSHGYIVRAEQMKWMASNALPPLVESQDIGAVALTRHAITSLHALEYVGGTPLRWTHPACLLRLAAGRKVTVKLETRNLRPGLAAHHLQAVALGGKPATIEVDADGRAWLRVETPSTASGIADLVLIAPELVEPAVAGEPGRRLGLPLFGVSVEFG
ncbi:glycosyltransferase family 77 protein [Bradyrhizobium arachidis]|uniref:glycosyltransferase family 77 protein n=1 Tax=Bradyrhizobium arachidis TaxID=858423 RepID=UPI002161586E|nr:glycosyltransferase family 77 protein [Bradyrhizobium arachidis]UVO31774.1 glycosyltransferase family 77 protein [Bradyrhizobium arachidis]